MTTVLKASKKNVSKCVELLRSSQAVVLPTDTIYGLAANALSDAACNEVFKLKKRSKTKPLIIHALKKDISKFAFIDERVKLLIKTMWPGPLSIVLKARDRSLISKVATASLSTIALRCPDQNFVQEVLNNIDFPLVMSSANVSFHNNNCSVKDIIRQFPLTNTTIFDGGISTLGIASTIVDLSEKNPIILREGTITALQIKQLLRQTVITLPSQLKYNYSLKKNLRLNVINPKENEDFIGFGDIYCEVNLSKNADLNEVAINLLTYLSTMDNKTKNNTIAIAPIPNRGIGKIINQKLRNMVQND